MVQFMILKLALAVLAPLLCSAEAEDEKQLSPTERMRMMLASHAEDKLDLDKYTKDKPSMTDAMAGPKIKSKPRSKPPKPVARPSGTQDTNSDSAAPAKASGFRIGVALVLLASLILFVTKHGISMMQALGQADILPRYDKQHRGKLV
eukprot:gnl/TRDRNA2_/TRDRNA2_90510_c0_seq2.p2 gnl/TRDRNA2_/TRDRNA2_90510_c0~~gnl/TRDRNA2_/TRDRNA2_90510_c0_seq2.p2  ORF type:complete len:148 (+),score=36.99 gnl/TRDRNA2_/TRDRNA2_90510_c0_seq2:129-572(+)